MKRRFFLKLSTAGAASVLWGCQDGSSMQLSHGPLAGAAAGVDASAGGGSHIVEGAETGTWRRGVHVSEREAAYTAFDAQGYSYEIESRAGRVVERGLFGLQLRQFGSFGLGQKQLNAPCALAFGPDELLYVLDHGNHRVQVFERDGGYAGQIGGPDTLSHPRDLFIDAEGLLFVADTLNHRVQVFDAAGQRVASFGELGSEPGQLNGPVGIAQGPDGLVHVLDAGNRRVQVFTTSGRFVRLYGEVPRGQAPLALARTLAVGSDGTAFVGDVASARVQIFTPEGRFEQSFAPRFADGAPAAPVDIALAPDGDLYVTAVAAAA